MARGYILGVAYYLLKFCRVCGGFGASTSQINQRGERSAVFAMGAQTSAQPDEKSQEDASAEELSAEVNAISEGDSVVDAKVKVYIP